MKSVKCLFTLVVIFFAFFGALELSAQDGGQTSTRKANLDLPVGVSVDRSDKEEAVGIVSLYGETFQGHCFVFVGTTTL